MFRPLPINSVTSSPRPMRRISAARVFSPVGDEQVMHAARVCGAWQAQLTARVGAKNVRNQLAIFDERFGIRCQTITVERRTAHGAHQVRPFVNGQPFRKQSLTDGALQNDDLR